MTRTRPDRCPGITRPWPADDGALVRVRLPGGRVDPRGLRALADLAASYGDGNVHLTSRANVQLRGLPADLPIADRLAAAGLLPSAAHDLVRNIMGTPLTGLVGGIADLRTTLAALDAALLADAELATLPGKFLFVLDDGRGDVVGGTFDLGAIALSADRALLLIDGSAHREVALGEVPTALAGLAREFLAVRGSGADAAWHVRELPGGARDLAPVAAWAAPPEPARPAYGPLTAAGTTHLEHLECPDGVLSAARAREIASQATQLVITPWRGIIAVHAGPVGTEPGATHTQAGKTEGEARP